MSAWEDIERQLASVNTYSYGDEGKADKNARAAIRRAFLDLERKAAERDDLRQMLLEQGMENARLSIESEQLRERDGALTGAHVARVKAEAWDEGFGAGFYKGQIMPDADASEADITNPYGRLVIPAASASSGRSGES